MRKFLLSLLCAAMTLNLLAVEGALSGKFSTNSAGTIAIQFSQGNLQYQASTDTWRFAENQYDVIGEDNKNISSSYEGWIDLFGWGTSGYDGKYPYMTSETPGSYGAGSKKAITGTDYDWGIYNAISNGGNAKGIWKTIDDTHLFGILQSRQNADKLFGFGTVNEVKGLILLPDNWKDPEGITFKPASENGMTWSSDDVGYVDAEGDSFDANTFTKDEWDDVMEANGAVFLPAAGIREGTTYNAESGGYVGFYWNTSYPSWSGNYHQGATTTFGNRYLFVGNGISYDNAHFGCAVRLIKNYEASVFYKVVIIQPEHGTISVKEKGVDLNAVAEGTTLHFVATPEDGYELDAWSGCDADGSLTVSAAATVTCTFKKKTFKVTFVDWNDAVLKAAQTVEWGAAAVPPAEPTREGYKFTGWDTDFSSVKSDLTVKAQYVEGVFFTVTFLDWDATLLLKETVEQGHDAKGPAVTPTREGYTFIGWSKPITNITADLTVIAQYEVAKVYYTVTFLDWDATELLKEQVEAGKDAKGPAVTPTREGYTFVGWSKPITNITADLTVIAQYEKAEQGLDNVQSDKVQCTKVIRDGQLYIMYKGTMYNVQGAKVK